MVARLIPDQKVGCSTHPVLTFFSFLHSWIPFHSSFPSHSVETG